jgi:prevent-host-death family protein
MGEWQLHDAKNRFSTVVDAALEGAPQYVTRRGIPVVVVVATENYERLVELDRAFGIEITKLIRDIPAMHRRTARDLMREL